MFELRSDDPAYDWGPQPWELDDPAEWERIIAADPGDDRPAHVLANLTPPDDDTFGPRPLADVLADAEHGPVGPGVFAELFTLDPAGLTDDEQVSLMVGWQRYEAACVGRKVAAVAAFDGQIPRDDTSEAAFAWAEVGAALRLGEGAGRQLAADARQVTTLLPRTFAALCAGQITWTKALALIGAAATLTPEQCLEMEARVLPHAAGRTPAQHRQAVTRWVARIDPDGVEARRARKRQDVALVRYSHGDGVADLLARYVDAADAELIWTAADTWARQQHATGDPRTLDELRVQALVDWAVRYLTGTPIRDHAPADGESAPGRLPAPAPVPVPTRNSYPAVINAIIGLPDLAERRGAGMLASGEPLPADAVADLLAKGAGVRFLLTDTDGNLVGISTRVHDPTAAQRAYLTLRDLTARTPTGSNASVAGQDLDHIDPHGPTEPANLHPPTRGWHRAKTFGHWTVRANPDRSITWTSRRTGRTYTTHPFDYRDGP